MNTFLYKLNAFNVSPTKKNPYLHHACRPVMMTLVENNRMIRHAVKYTAPELFECAADGILEADEKFQKATGINPTKRPDIGCSFK